MPTGPAGHTQAAVHALRALTDILLYTMGRPSFSPGIPSGDISAHSAQPGGGGGGGTTSNPLEPAGAGDAAAAALSALRGLHARSMQGGGGDAGRVIQLPPGAPPGISWGLYMDCP